MKWGKFPWLYFQKNVCTGLLIHLCEYWISIFHTNSSKFFFEENECPVNKFNWILKILIENLTIYTAICEVLFLPSLQHFVKKKTGKVFPGSVPKNFFNFTVRFLWIYLSCLCFFFLVVLSTVFTNIYCLCWQFSTDWIWQRLFYYL